MKKRILILTWHGGAGGVSRLVYEMARLISADKELDITIGYANEGGMFCDKVQNIGIPVCVFNMKNGFDVLSAIKIMRFIRKSKFHLIHMHYITPLLRLFVYFGNRNIMITEHVGIPEYKKKMSWFLYKMISILIKKTALIYTTVSENSKAELIANNFVEKNKIVVIPNGVDLELFSRKNAKPILRQSGNDGSKILIGTVRGLSKRHGVDHFILMARELSKTNNNLQFIVAGDGAQRKCLEDMVQKYGLSDRVLFLGERSDVPDILASLDIVILPSEIETFGIFATEAMAIQVPVVAYAVGGLPEVIADGETGILVYGRDPKKLANAVSILLDNETRRKEMGVKGRQRVETNFDIKKVIPQYVELYKSLRIREALS
jgi:glycosyltransferase involved in cell wall biosynthesis